MRFSLIAAIALITVGTLSCSKTDESRPSANTTGTGCLQGITVNGLSRDRIAIPQPNGTNGIYVVVRNSLIGAVPMIDGADANANKNLVGDFVACNIPTDITFPVVAWIDGYQAFEGTVKVPSTAAPLAGAATKDNDVAIPTVVGNLQLFPKNYQVSDLKVYVTTYAGAMSGAFVYLTPTNTNTGANGNTNYITVNSSRSLPLSGTTDASGLVTFKATDLTLGQQYLYRVVPSDKGAAAVYSEGNFILGLRTAATAATAGDPYTLRIALTPSVGDLAVVGTTVDASGDESVSSDGSITYFFNRNIEIAPNTSDAITATLNNQVAAVLAVPVAANDTSEQVTVTVSDNKLTLKPVFTTAPAKATEPNITVTFGGVSIRAKDAPNQPVKTLTGLTAGAKLTTRLY